jgi:molecular chaperone GrpE
MAENPRRWGLPALTGACHPLAPPREKSYPNYFTIMAEPTEDQQQHTPDTSAQEQESASKAETPAGGSEEIEKLKQEVGEFKDKYLRLYSEFDNFRKRSIKEKSEFLKSANKDLILSLLPVIDDLERAEKAFDPEKSQVSQLKEGYDLIFNKLRKALEKAGLQAIENTKGQAFDVELHEAVTQFPAPSDDLKGKVVDELEKGYRLDDKVIRFAKVVVGA